MKNDFVLAKKVLNILNDHGYEAYLVGGFVRDFLLEIPSTDIDIATNATPQEVGELFPKTKNTGLKFGTVTIFLENSAYEVTTFRTDGVYKDNRHPEGVTYSKTLEADLIRRDFTVNALAMDSMGKIYDFCDGLTDLKTKTLRAIGDPDRRFTEDALRILRAFRFVAKLAFTIEEKTFSSLSRNRDLLSKISVERIMQEIKLIIPQPNAFKAFQALVETGVSSVFPDLEKGIRFLSTFTKIPLDLYQFYALCFFLSTQEISDFWRFSNKEKDIIQKLIALLTVTENDGYNEVLVYAYGKDICLKANAVGRLIHPENDQEKQIIAVDSALPIRQTCDLKFKGQDIISTFEVKDAALIGEIIGDLILNVITHQLPNEYEALKAHALKRIKLLDTGKGL